MNIKTFSAATTRRNVYHKPVIAAVKKAYNDFLTLARLKPNNDYHYTRLYHEHHHKGEPRNNNHY